MEGDPVALFLNLDGWREDGFGADSDDSAASDSLSASSETYLLGFVLANIVGVQYYNGSITGREAVVLVREPLNPYDENAVKVLNTRGLQVGHIERTAAAVVSPMIDSNLITVEGIVAKSGSPRRHRIPCQIHIFAKIDAFPTVQRALSESGLNLIAASNPSFALSESVSVRERRNTDGIKSLDDIFMLVDENVRNKAAMEPLEPPKKVIVADLFAHQKEALGWLVHREISDELPPFWEFKDCEYVNVLTNFKTEVRPEPIRGGIFADDMGLGKTLTLLSLIALDKCTSTIRLSSDRGNGVKVVNDEENYCGGEGDGTLELDIPSSRKYWRRTMNTATSNSRKRSRAEKCGGLDRFPGGKSIESGISREGETLKTTLVVCPPSVFSSWITQLCDHTRPGSLKVCMYYGSDRTHDPEVLRKCDIVLTTYSTLGSERRSKESPLKKMDWWRIILDEAHMIKNANAQQTKAVTDLNAKRRWAVTGTPIQNGSFDLFSLMAFLRFEPFSDKSYWNRLIQRPLAQGEANGLSRLQVLMATISLRRTKDKTVTGLPPKTVETCVVELSPEERQFYDQVEDEAKTVVKSYISDGSVMRNYANILSLILRLRQICTDMALCPPDLRSIISATNIEDVSNNPELLGKMVALLQDGEDFDCPICISPPTRAVITRCAHIFCQGCIVKTLRRSKPSCPMCRHPLTESDLFAAPPEQSEIKPEGTGGDSNNVMSSKGSALLKFLNEMKDQKPDAKSVVFSQFRKMLQLLERPLKEAGFKVLVLDGTMTAKKRASVIEKFNAPGPDSPTVLLASLKSSGTGINLTAASTVYLLEPWWNPAVEEQAMDRVHRIGQKEEVKIVRMIAKDTIEGRVLALQEKKRNLARDAFGSKGTKEKREVNVDDVRTLMSL